MTDAFEAFLGGVSGSVTGVSFGALAVALALHTGKLVAEARSWHWIVSHAHQGAPVRFGTTLGAFVAAVGANAVLPARVGEALRVGAVRKRVPGSSVPTIAATIVLETAIEVVFGADVIVAVVVGGRGVFAGSTPALAELGASPILLGAVLAAALAGLLLAIAFRGRAASLVHRMARGFSVLTAPRVFVTGVLSWKLVAWALRLGAVYAFLVAFHVPAAPWTAAVVVAAQNVAGAVPLLPGNAGTQQAAIGVALAGTASATGLLGFGVGMQASTAVADLVLGSAALVLLAGRGDLRAALRAVRPARGASRTAATSTVAP